MISIQSLTAFFGWSSLIGIAMIILVLGMIRFLHGWIGRIHAKLFGVSEEEARAALLRAYLQLRVAVATLFIIPFLALLIIAEA